MKIPAIIFQNNYNKHQNITYRGYNKTITKPLYCKATPKDFALAESVNAEVSKIKNSVFFIVNNIKEIIDNNSKNDLGYKEIIGCFGVKSSEVFYDPTTKNLIKQNNYHRATGLSGRNLEDFIKSTIPLWKETYYNPTTGKQIYSKEYNDSGITPINEKFFDYDSGKRIILSYYGFNRPAEHVAIYPNLITLNKEKEAWFNLDGETIGIIREYDIENGDLLKQIFY